MLGRKTYEREEIARARATLRHQLAEWDALDEATTDPGARRALDALAPSFFNDLVLVVDRNFVHRVRMVTGKDDNALNEVELLTESLMNNDGVLRSGRVIRYDATTSVTGLADGDRIVLDRVGLERLADAFFAVLEERFLE